jgi:hypothetical protein
MNLSSETERMLDEARVRLDLDKPDLTDAPCDYLHLKKI